MQYFSFLGDVQVAFPLLFRAGGRPAGRTAGRLEKTKIRLSLSPAMLSLGLAELGNMMIVGGRCRKLHQFSNCLIDWDSYYDIFTQAQVKSMKTA